VGHYERTAAQLAPVSGVVIERAAPQPAERVLDLGCGTGNAALLAAARGATVIGVDPAARLLEVARARAADAGLEATFALGEGAAIPVESATVDVVVSVFGVIFAPDPVAAAAELARVSGPHGRVVLSAWLPGGAVGEVVRMARGTAMAALDAPPPPAPFAWHDQDALSGLLAPHGFEVDMERHAHVFTAPSIEAFLQAELVDHPVSSASRAMLEAQGKADVQATIVDRAREILTEANETTAGFAVTSSYVVATARRPPARPRPR
jgi:SAM-dependent methyltransferase